MNEKQPKNNQKLIFEIWEKAIQKFFVLFVQLFSVRNYVKINKY